MKNNVIKICIILGAVSIVLIIFGVLVLLLTNWCIKSLLFDLCLAIGSGLLCSAVVSLLIEKSNNKILEQSHRNKREFILNAFQTGIVHLLQIEYNALQNFIFLKNRSDSIKQEKKEDSVKSLTIKIQGLLKNILDCLKTRTYSSADNYLRDMQREYAYRVSVNQYRIVSKIIQEILSEGGTYLVGNILSNKQLEQLQKLETQIEDVILYSSGENYELLFIQKQLLFYLLLMSLEILQLDSDKKIAYLNLSISDT